MNFDLTDIDWVWFDLDDTLIDFTTNAHTSLVEMWRDEPLLRRLFADAETWADTYERHNMALWAEYNVGRITRHFLRLQRFIRPLTDGGASPDEALEAARRYDTLYLDYLARQKTLMPGARTMLDRLRAIDGAPRIGILSNGFQEVQFRKIDTAGLTPYIDLVVLSDDIGVNKPDRRIYDHAMSRAGVADPKRHLMIGDNPDTDIAGALAAGWQAIWYHPTRAFAGVPCPQGANEITNLNDIF
ncbi:MAG: YjjG family noncanonical pyrimidine nucleotidase [Bacteroides sp.]|nr:YjjG family noncanonical pyrimidine nucleotidase [Bacteroides sp.]MCM1413270.1 YjjG family noncanonical pyrimidine nucleotidase [Bacteroides sp.]MCM1471420.1 YjjG family noncanonical pyrimidine nucleotidase [Bacteroides sp.]